MSKKIAVLMDPIERHQPGDDAGSPEAWLVSVLPATTGSVHA